MPATGDAKIISMAISICKTKCLYSPRTIETNRLFMLTLSDIRTARKRKKMTQGDAAKEINCQRERITAIETGISKATIGELETLAVAYGFNILLVDAGEMRILQAFEAEKVKYRQFLAENRGKCGE